MRASNGYVVLCVVIAACSRFGGLWRRFFELGGRWWSRPPGISMAAFPAQIGAGANWQFSANVVGGSAGQGVTWAVVLLGENNRFHRTFIAAGASGHFSDACHGHSSFLRVIRHASAAADITITTTDPLGTAAGTTIACPEFSDGLPASTSTCYRFEPGARGSPI